MLADVAKLFKRGTHVQFGTTGVSWLYKPQDQVGYVTDGIKRVFVQDVGMNIDDPHGRPTVLGAINKLGCDVLQQIGPAPPTYLCRWK